VIEKELTDALVSAAGAGGWSFGQFHVAPVWVDNEAGIRRGRHEWWIASEGGGGRAGQKEREALARELDRALAAVNEDYAAKRAGGGMDAPLARIVGPEVFETWMRDRGKWGGQNKMPRCRSDRVIADELARHSARGIANCQ
jgi:hypothetical protein